MSATVRNIRRGQTWDRGEMKPSGTHTAQGFCKTDKQSKSFRPNLQWSVASDCLNTPPQQPLNPPRRLSMVAAQGRRCGGGNTSTSATRHARHAHRAATMARLPPYRVRNASPYTVAQAT